MSKDIYLDPSTNDLYIYNGELRLTETQEEVTRQKCQISLSTYKGEVFWDIDAGVPWLANDNNPIQLLSKSTTDKRFVDVVLQANILNREGIIGISSYESVWDKPTGKLTITFTATTETGEPISVEDIELNF